MNAVAETAVIMQGLEVLAPTAAVVYVVRRLGPKPRGGQQAANGGTAGRNGTGRTTPGQEGPKL